MPKGGVVLLENVRFHKGETKNHEDFAKALATSSGANAYVNDVWHAHRPRRRRAWSSILMVLPLVER